MKKMLLVLAAAGLLTACHPPTQPDPVVHDCVNVKLDNGTTLKCPAQ